MIDHQQARQIVTDLLITHPGRGSDDLLLELRILNEHTIEADFGWVFFWQSQRFLETGSFSGQLSGNAPLIVDRRDGALHVTGTAHPTEHDIQQYPQERPLG
jgi:immunity protein 35 of polymorphic toxin system